MPRKQRSHPTGTALELPGQHCFDLGVGNGARRPRSRFIQQPVHPIREGPCPPSFHRLLRHAQVARHACVRLARRAAENHARALGQRLRCGRPPRPAFERLAFLNGERDTRCRTTGALSVLLSLQRTRGPYHVLRSFLSQDARRGRQMGRPVPAEPDRVRCRLRHHGLLLDRPWRVDSSLRSRLPRHAPVKAWMDVVDGLDGLRSSAARHRMRRVLLARFRPHDHAPRTR